MCENRFIGEGGRLISEILKISEGLNLKGYIVPVDMEIQLMQTILLFS